MITKPFATLQNVTLYACNIFCQSFTIKSLIYKSNVGLYKSKLYIKFILKSNISHRFMHGIIDNWHKNIFNFIPKQLFIWFIFQIVQNEITTKFTKCALRRCALFLSHLLLSLAYATLDYFRLLKRKERLELKHKYLMNLLFIGIQIRKNVIDNTIKLF